MQDRSEDASRPLHDHSSVGDAVHPLLAPRHNSPPRPETPGEYEQTDKSQSQEGQPQKDRLVVVKYLHQPNKQARRHQPDRQPRALPRSPVPKQLLALFQGVGMGRDFHLTYSSNDWNDCFSLRSYKGTTNAPPESRQVSKNRCGTGLRPALVRRAASEPPLSSDVALKVTHQPSHRCYTQ